jgi:YfiH family protein
VQKNRALMADALGVSEQRLLVPYQVHSPDVLIAHDIWQERPRVDGLVTNVPGLAIGVTGADCGMLLFADPQSRVIGACHAGWKGALTGVLENTLAKMEELGAKRSAISAVLGPTIGAKSYEVGPEFVARFAQDEEEAQRFFSKSPRDGHAMFDLPGFIAMRLQRAGVMQFHDLGLDTYADEERFFSYRRTTHRKEADYGRLVSAIALV